MADIGSREELAAMIQGKSDEEIKAGVADLGTEKVLGQIFEFMATQFQPDKAGGQSAVIGWDITGQLDGMQAFMTGKLKLAGDMMFAQSMQAWFRS